MANAGRPKPFVATKCCKCNSVMHSIRTPMALMKVRAKGLGPAAHAIVGGTGMVVYPKRCPYCGFVELYSPSELQVKPGRVQIRFRRTVGSTTRN